MSKLKTVYVENGNLLPAGNVNVPYWSDLNGITSNEDGYIYYSSDDISYYDQKTDEEVLVEEFSR